MICTAMQTLHVFVMRGSRASCWPIDCNISQVHLRVAVVTTLCHEGVATLELERPIRPRIRLDVMNEERGDELGDAAGKDRDRGKRG